MARRHGVRFGHVAFDAVYGSAGWLLRGLDDEGITFMGEVRCDQHLFLQDPTPSVPRRTSTMGRPPSLLRTEARAITVSQWLKAQPASAWRRIVLRGGEKGLITIEALSARVWLWDGQEDHARRWHLFMRREINRPDTVKFALSNAKADTSLHRLASIAGISDGRRLAARHEPILSQNNLAWPSLAPLIPLLSMCQPRQQPQGCNHTDKRYQSRCERTERAESC